MGHLRRQGGCHGRDHGRGKGCDICVSDCLLYHASIGDQLRVRIASVHGGQKARPPEGDAQSTIDDALFQNEENDKREEYEGCKYQQPVQPICLLERSHKLLRSAEQASKYVMS